MRVATFNLHHGAAPGRGVDLARSCRAVEGLGADVVGLQEVDRGTDRVGGADHPLLLRRATGAHVHFAPAIRFGGGEYGNALVVRGTVLEVEDVALAGVGEDRVVAVALVEVDAVRWWVAVTHLQNRGRGRPDEAPGQLLRVLAELDDRAGASGRALLLGDLNLGPAEVEPALARHGYRAAIGPPTFPARRPREHIDWIAARGAPFGEVTAPDTGVSDHRPLVAEIVPNASPGADLHMDDARRPPYG
jgi:endonuclease/exonuclease/phosphatase family metal-dependent hydrolase